MTNNFTKSSVVSKEHTKAEIRKKSDFFVGKFRKLSKFVIVNLILLNVSVRSKRELDCFLMFEDWIIYSKSLTKTDFCKCFYVQYSELIRHLLECFSFSDLVLLHQFCSLFEYTC